jgi:hypothetical protein
MKLSISSSQSQAFFDSTIHHLLLNLEDLSQNAISLVTLSSKALSFFFSFDACKQDGTTSPLINKPLLLIGPIICAFQCTEIDEFALDKKIL